MPPALPPAAEEERSPASPSHAPIPGTCVQTAGVESASLHTQAMLPGRDLAGQPQSGLGHTGQPASSPGAACAPAQTGFCAQTSRVRVATPCPQRSDLTDVRALRIQGTGPKSLAAPQDVLTQSHCAGCPGRRLPLESAEGSPGRQSSSPEPEPEALTRILKHPMFLLRPPLQRGSLGKT